MTGNIPESAERTWKGVVALEGEATTDGRIIQPGTLRFPNRPVPLLGPDRALVGRVDRFWREGEEVWAEGVEVFHSSVLGLALEVDDIRAQIEDEMLVISSARCVAVVKHQNPAWGRASIREFDGVKVGHGG